MDALTYLATKYDLDLTSRRLPIRIPDTDRLSFARLTYLLGHTRGAEIGVERAMFTTAWLDANPLLSLLAVDAWRAYRGYRDHVDQAKLDRFHGETLASLVPYGARASVVREWSVAAAAQVPDNSLDVVYLDAAHDLASVVADLAAWVPKVCVGGLVAGHDYVTAHLPSLMHVPQALHAWTSAYEIAPWFVFGADAKVPGQRRDDGRSWCFVKPAPVVTRRRIRH